MKNADTINSWQKVLFMIKIGEERECDAFLRKNFNSKLSQFRVLPNFTFFLLIWNLELQTSRGTNFYPKFKHLWANHIKACFFEYFLNRLENICIVKIELENIMSLCKTSF
jgi:hypothetical protein